MAEKRILVSVENRRLTLTNLDKVLYPSSGFTKRDVLDYYRQVAPVLLPHLRDRATTFLRYPDGVEGESFYEKDVRRHAPAWVRTARLAVTSRTEGSEMLDYPVIDELPTLIWAANLAALELHIPQWTVGPRGARRNPDLLVFDLDPGAPATLVECCRVAEWLRDALAEDGLTAYPKTSGAKGMQLYCPVRTGKPERTSEYAKLLAEPVGERAPRRGGRPDDQGRAAGQGLHRLEPEQHGEDHRGAVFVAWQGAADRLHSGDLGGGGSLPARVRADLHQ